MFIHSFGIALKFGRLTDSATEAAAPIPIGKVTGTFQYPISWVRDAVQNLAESYDKTFIYIMYIILKPEPKRANDCYTYTDCQLK